MTTGTVSLPNKIEWAEQNDLNFLNPSALSGDEAKFLWVDVETTGLDTKTDVVLEVGAVITDAEGFVVAEPVQFLVADPAYQERAAAAMANMIPLVEKMHRDSGLWDDLISLNSKYTYAAIEASLTEYVSVNSNAPGTVRLAGSSAHFDRYMLLEFCPTFVNSIHYRTIDVSTLKELCRELNPELYARLDEQTNPQKLHRSLPDLADTLHEFAFYVDHFLFI